MRIKYIVLLAVLIHRIGLAQTEPAPVLFQVSVSRPEFSLHDPILLDCVLTNCDPNLTYAFGMPYPDRFNVLFTCDDPGCVSVNQWVVPPGHTPRESIPPHGAASRKIVLNRFLKFTQAKEYTVRYQAQFTHATTRADGRNSPVFKGAFKFRLHTNSFDRKLVAEARQILETDHTLPGAQAFETLLWVDDLQTLLGLAPYVAYFGDSGPDYLSRLEAYLPDERAARAITTELDSKEFSKLHTFFAALVAVRKNSIVIPPEGYQQLLADQTGLVHRSALVTHLLKSQNAANIRVALTVTNDPDPAIAKLAHDFLKERKLQE